VFAIIFAGHGLVFQIIPPPPSGLELVLSREPLLLEIGKLPELTSSKEGSFDSFAKTVIDIESFCSTFSKPSQEILKSIPLEFNFKFEIEPEEFSTVAVFADQSPLAAIVFFGVFINAAIPMLPIATFRIIERLLGFIIKKCDSMSINVVSF
jgi:hypothetical protein